MDSDPADSASGPLPTVVIGGGIAGIAVAAELDDVVLFEATAALGGRAARSGGVMFFVNTPEQAACGLTDSAELAAADWPEITGAEATEGTLRWFEESAAVAAHLRDLGVTYQIPCRSEYTTPRGHLVVGEGPALVAALLSTLPEAVDRRMETPVDQLVVDEAGVAGVMVGDTFVASRQVIIASGGFAGNAELISAAGTFAPGTWRPTDLTDGNGWAATQGPAVGAGLASFERIGAYPVAVAVSAEAGYAVTPDGEPLVVRSVFVDGAGESFEHNDENGSFKQSLAVRQHEPVWAIVANDTIGELYAIPENRALVEEVKVCAGSVRHLAEKMGMEATTLSASLDRLPELDARVFSAKPDVEIPGGLCALPVGWSVQKSFGGLDVDLDGRVRNTDGDVIPGLWAVGEAAGMGVPGMGGLVGFDGSLSAVLWSALRTADAIRETG